jgi:bifunctional UDP-N-acetylglucosamine pyrophosphorylase/glucosamine-1-phosphate N-acetyltransferase
MKSDIPKVLHTLCGRPMIAYTLDLAASAGVKQPIVVIGHGAQEVKSYLPKEVKSVIQPRQLGTADAVLAAKKALGGLSGDLLILYADTPLLRRTTVQHLVEAHFKTSATVTLLSTHLANPAGYGRIVREATGQITGVVEENEANAAQRSIREINVGPLVCKTQALFDALAAVKPSGAKKELYLTAAISHVAHQEGTKIQAVRVEETSEALGINSRLDLARATSVIRQRIIDSHLRNGVTIEDPQTTFIEQGVTIGHDTVIHPYSVIHSGVSIGRRCSIGPFARLRSGVTIADEVRVGNFVEMVRTKVGSHVRINHVAYLGDATVEEHVNIGAGTITANYDGTAKHPTHIGKGAFIGSDTVLIAPVNIGQGAITGAGSVVTREHHVPPRGIVVGVPARALNTAAARDGRAAAHAAKTQPPSRPKPKPSRVKPRKPAAKAKKVSKRPVRRQVARKVKRPVRTARTQRSRRHARRRVAARAR